jgi:hypothetical protein
MAQSVPIHEKDDLSIEWSKPEECLSHSMMKWIDRAIEEFDVIGLTAKSSTYPEQMRPTSIVLEETLMSDAEEPETILWRRWNVIDPSPRHGKYFGNDIRNVGRGQRNSASDEGIDELVVGNIESFELRLSFLRSVSRHDPHFLRLFTFTTCRKRV